MNGPAMSGCNLVNTSGAMTAPKNNIPPNRAARPKAVRMLPTAMLIAIQLVLERPALGKAQIFGLLLGKRRELRAHFRQMQRRYFFIQMPWQHVHLVLVL